MDSLSKGISGLRKVSLYLFIVPTIGLFASLFLHNFLASFSFLSTLNKYDKLPITIKCNKENKFCTNIIFDKTTSFETCHKNKVDFYILAEGNKLNIADYKNKYLLDGKYNESQLLELNTQITYYKTDLPNIYCIHSSKFFSNIYKFFPNLFYLIENFKKGSKYKPATSNIVNPFIYGETSISNLVKRYPVNLVFKPLLFISSILMILYWISYNKILKKINHNIKLNKFAILGIFSSIFLFLHVFFLGMEIESEILNKIRRLILILFIFSEITAQFFLTRRLYLSYEKINHLVYKNILNLKIIFVSVTLIGTVTILTILSFYNLDSKFDYILEWNYFLFLLVFYLLSYLLWKKN